jgi:hypothetical protein
VKIPHDLIMSILYRSFVFNLHTDYSHSFPASVSALKSYASFVLDCLNSRELAEDILDHADRLRDENTEGNNNEKGGKGKQIKSTGSALLDNDDEKSDAGAGRNHGTNSSDVLQSISATSLFDVEGWHERRNGIALARFNILRRTVGISLLSLLLIYVLLFFLGRGFVSRERSDRDVLLNAG